MRCDTSIAPRSWRARCNAACLRRALPQIAGLDVAAHYEPSAPEEVGGDFYDLFALSAGRTGFFLGDVCGKGPEAAAVTSLARYTMRTAAMLREQPDAILADLNAALRIDGPASSMQTCIDGVAVDEQRVFELLAGTPRASAQALVNRLVHALRATPRPMRDDIAIMVLRRVSLA